MTPFTGLSAFPLTPIHDDHVDERAFVTLIQRLTAAAPDSITALGSTGSAAYLDRDERATTARLAVEHAGEIPVFVGVGALRTSHVLQHVDDAEAAGAAGLLLAPMSYQPLTDEDVFQLYRTVTSHTALPVIVYDNPSTTHVTFSLDLYARIAQLPGIASVKIPGIPGDLEDVRERVTAIRAVLPDRVTLGISGDAWATTGLQAGCDAWYSAIGGTLPGPAIAITRAIKEGRLRDARDASDRLTPLWELFAECGGSLRVIAAIAEHLGLVAGPSLPLPLLGLTPPQRERVAHIIDDLGLAKE